MAKTAMTHARITPEIKKQAEDIIKGLGLSISAAHEIYYRQIIAHQGIPFDMRVFKKETIQAMEAARNGIGTKYDSINDMLDEMDS